MISIIVPVYNTEKYLSECIESVLEQSYTNFELILINDGSTDKSAFICDEYATKDKRIKVIHKKNAGVSSARNYGIKIAQGNYILFLDSDDWYDLDFIDNIYKVADIETLNISGYKIIRESTKEIVYFNSEKDTMLEVNQICELHKKCLIGSPINKLYSTQIIIENKLHFDEKASLGEDFMFNLEYSLYIKNFYVINYYGYNYRRVGDETLSNRYIVNMYDKYKKIYGKFYETLLTLNVWNAETKYYFYNEYIGRLNLSIVNIFNEKNKNSIIQKLSDVKVIIKCTDFITAVSYVNNIPRISKVILKTRSTFIGYIFYKCHNIYSNLKPK